MSFDRYGFYGEVSYMNQNRFRPYSIAGLGAVPSIPAELSGHYRGQPGRLIYPAPRPSREHDRALFRSLDVQFAGFGATDREICNTLLTTSGAIATAAGSAFGPQPTQRSGETTQAYEARLRDWQIATRTSTTGGGVLSAASSLCNLINEANQPAPTDPSATANDWQLMQAREDLRRLYEQQQAQASVCASAGVNNKTLLLVGGGLAAAAAVYFLFFR